MLNLALLVAVLKAGWDALYRWATKRPAGLMYESDLYGFPYGKIRLFHPQEADAYMTYTPMGLYTTGDSVTVTTTLTFT